MTNTTIIAASLSAEISHGTVIVRDAAGGVWHPSDDALAEIGGPSARTTAGRQRLERFADSEYPGAPGIGCVVSGSATQRSSSSRTTARASGRSHGDVLHVIESPRPLTDF